MLRMARLGHVHQVEWQIAQMRSPAVGQWRLIVMVGWILAGLVVAAEPAITGELEGVAVIVIFGITLVIWIMP